MITKTKSLDDLETGVKLLLLENRCSFSDEDKVLLNDCILTIQQAKKSADVSVIVNILEILLKLFVTADHLKDVF
jgi:hypothetical protein